MKIGVIGAGVAGLTSAWLLNDDHEVTLFEKEDRLGGHAYTVEIDYDGHLIPIDSGFEFFSKGMYPTFTRLLNLLQVSLEPFDATMTVYAQNHSSNPRAPILLPPFRYGRVVWSALRPEALNILLQFRAFLGHAVKLIEFGNTSLTIESFIESLNFSVAFKNDFLYPLLLSFWCVEMADFKTFSAYNAVAYLAGNLPPGIGAPTMTKIAGGMRVYIDALAQQLTRATIKLSACITRITRVDNLYIVEDADGNRHEFDHLILAVNPRDASTLLEPLPDFDSVRHELSRFDFFKTTIAIHGDRRLMPNPEKFWSVVNTRWDGEYSALSVWIGGKRNPLDYTPLFKSWVTFENQMPEPLYKLVTFDHLKVNLSYYSAQKNLRASQGQNNLWLAGVYAHSIDSHESAILSAVNIARRLDPDSKRLKQLVRV